MLNKEEQYQGDTKEVPEQVVLKTNEQRIIKRRTRKATMLNKEQ
jgi:hypothetical protein